MSMTIWTPIIGRARFAASVLLVSVFGFPFAGSFGSFKPTMFPHRAPPQLTMATLALPLSVSQFPRGSPADAGVPAARPRTANAALARILLMNVALPFRKPPEFIVGAPPNASDSLASQGSHVDNLTRPSKLRRAHGLNLKIDFAAAACDRVSGPRRYLLTRLQYSAYACP